MQAIEGAAVSAAAEDYVKTIFSLTSEANPMAATTELADRLRLSAGSVSTMIKRLDSAGLAEHVPYRGVRLTAEGERLALRVIRRHRLLESFLARQLDIAWDDVHRFADALEHAASDELIEIISAKLGDPDTDPHGAPIPSRELVIPEEDTRSLIELAPGQRAVLVRVSAPDPAMLRYLSERGIAIGDELEMLGREPFDGPC
ncbi:MAG: metal-dependent transcriptional regulator, partial [Sciscionella sp.]